MSEPEELSNLLSPTPSTIKTGWENEPKVSDLKSDYTNALSDTQDHITKVDRWLDNLHITGSAKIKTGKNRSQMQPKLIRKQAEWRYASLGEPFLSTPDIFNIHPITANDVDSAKQNELVLNNQFNTKLKKVRLINEFVRTCVDEGTTIAKLGWEYVEEEVEVEVPDFEAVRVTDQMVAQQIQQSVQLSQEQPEVFEKQATEETKQTVQATLESGVPTLVRQVGVHTEIETQAVVNQPTVDIINYNNITIDPTCEGQLEKAQFIILSFETNLSELRKANKYENLDEINIANETILGAPDNHISEDDSSFNFVDEPRKKFIAYEYWGYWDIDGSGIVKSIVATWVGDTLIQLEENPFPKGELPFVAVQLLPVKKSVYGEPDGALIEDNQKIVGAVTRGMIDIMGRSANGQVGSAKDALDVTNQRKFDSGENYKYNPNSDPSKAFYMHVAPEIPQSAQVMLQLQNQDAESLTGVKAFSSGISGSALGNMLDIQTDIPMLDGSFKKLVDIVDGDMLIGSDGKGTSVVKAHPVKEPKIAYTMNFDNDSSVCSGGEHLWTIKVQGTKHSLREWHTVDANTVFQHIKAGRKVTIPKIQEVHTGIEASSTIDPLPHKRTVTIKSMCTTGIVPMRCLTVDSSDKLFAVTDKFTLTHNTATGIRSALDATSKRELDILLRLAEGMKEIGRKIIAMNAVFLTEPEIVRITDEEFVEVKPDDLAGNFDLRLAISTAEADNQKAEELSFMLQTGQQSMDQGEVRMIRAEVARLRKMPALAKKIEDYQPQPDPIQQQLAQLEVQKLQAEIAKLQSETQENYAGAQLDAAKAGETSSNTDLKNLDFLEQESGTKQERNLELAGRQAVGNIALKDRESQLRMQENQQQAVLNAATPNQPRG